MIETISERDWKDVARAAILFSPPAIRRLTDRPFASLSQQAMQVSRPLDGRVAVVTGSTSGIGLGIASALAEAGAMIVLNGLGDEAEIDNVRNVLSARYDVPVRYDHADMANPADITAMIARTAGTFGPADILVNNAGVQHVAPSDVSAGEVGPDPRHQPLRGVPCDKRCAAGDEAAWLGPYR